MKTLRMIWRQAKRNRLMTFVNVVGLSISTAVLILLALLVLHEVRYDRSIPNSDRLVFAGSYAEHSSNQVIKWPIISAGVPVDLKREVPFIEDYVRFHGTWENEKALTWEQNMINAQGVFQVDSSFFNVTGVELSQGDEKQALAAPDAAVLTRDFAKKLFGDIDPMGKEILYNGNHPVTVTGIIEKMPAPSMLNGMNVLISWSTFNPGREDWNSNINYYCLLKLSDGASFSDLRKGVDEATDRYFEVHPKDSSYIFNISLTPLQDVHLFGDFDPFPINSGRIGTVIQFVAIGVFLLIIAILNYINLTTAQSLKRGIYVGIAKVLGANREMLIRQFITEAIFLTVLSVSIGTLMAILFLPSFSHLVNIPIDQVIGSYTTLSLILLCAGIVFGAFMGIVPALILSGIKPVSAFKKEATTGKKGKSVRSALVIFQFAVASGLIIGSLVVLRQMNYMRTTDIGFNRENVLTVKMSNWDLMTSYNTLYEKYKNKPYVISSSTADHLPLFGGEVSSYLTPGRSEEERIFMRRRNVDHDYIKTVGMRLVAGRNFNPDITSDSVNAVIVNQTASSLLGYGDNPIGKTFTNIRYYNTNDRVDGEANIIGMIEDYHYSSLRNEIKPVFLRIYQGYPPWLIFRLQPGTEHQAITDLQTLWKEFAPGIQLQYSFIDEQFDALYRSEQRLSKLFKLFTLIAIIVAGMGLFAMSAFIAERKTKEIGVRKVLGASIHQIVTMLVSDFIKLVLVANAIAWPLSWWIMDRWLQGYAYRTHMDMKIFIATLSLSLILALVAVSVHAVRASLLNPVKTLRDE